MCNHLMEVSADVKECFLVSAENYDELIRIIAEAQIHKEASSEKFAEIVLREIYLPGDAEKIRKAIEDSKDVYSAYVGRKDVTVRELLDAIMEEIYIGVLAVDLLQDYDEE